ncbi:hypothetical protein ACFO5K_04345 [Nocardia halotolerans]|uniref:Uncharacterized protein n=1 Tax=Nocardia halotolerans TaxID=1755878 RepID=A0ABV8VCU4_9NOCA
MSTFGGYNHKLYYRVEDLAEIADYTTRGPKQDAAVDRYLEALHAICAHRSNIEAEKKMGARIREIVASDRADNYPKKAAA